MTFNFIVITYVSVINTEQMILKEITSSATINFISSTYFIPFVELYRDYFTTITSKECVIIFIMVY